MFKNFKSKLIPVLLLISLGIFIFLITIRSILKEYYTNSYTKKFLKVGGTVHNKNEIGFKLLAEEANASIDTVNNPDVEYDLIWIPSGFHHSSEFPNGKRLLYGPHNFVFPEGEWIKKQPKFDRSIYTSLSEFNKIVYEEFGTFCMPIEPIPFPVDINKFTPVVNKKIEYDCFVYFKRRHRNILDNIEEYLKKNNITFKIIEYSKYKEEEYIDLLNSVKFGIWLGSHESQGFAVQESLSMNIPLIVYNVKTLFDEIGPDDKSTNEQYRNKYQLIATTTPYWDDRCGLHIYSLNELDNTVQYMLNNYTRYMPRDYIIETLSPKVCLNRIYETFANYTQTT